MTLFAEYIWIDGTEPTAKLRSKTKVIHGSDLDPLDPSSYPDWSFDGSSTGQAPGNSSDCVLKPVFVVPDPTRGTSSMTYRDGGLTLTQAEYKGVLVLCEVFDSDGETPHPTNTRAKLRDVIGLPWKADVAEGSIEAEIMDCWFGLEQEYTLFQGTRPLGFPENGFPAPQGPYYCGVGADEVSGRPLVEAHMEACSEAGIKISGVNAEVMPGQWEFQIGPTRTLETGDHMWIARWLLYRLGEDYNISATLDPKPAKGDWNGAGMHTNFSTPAMREEGGMEKILEFCNRAGKHIDGHLAVYGAGIESRLTGKHETCSYKEFKYGVSDRTASIRIPLATKLEDRGYLEDRRPNANADPYEVVSAMIKTAYNRW